jgi:peptide/nickel transport system substrate-binding protein
MNTYPLEPLRRRAWRAVAALTATGLILAGCGGNDDDADVSEPTATDPESETTTPDAGTTGDAGPTPTDDTTPDDTTPDDTTPDAGSAPTSEPAGDVKVGGTLVVLDSTDTDSYDTVDSLLSVATDGYETVLVYDSLIQLGKTGEVIPRLAESLEPNDDYSEWTLTLRPELLFSDGTPLDADAVVFNWQRHLDEEGSRCKAPFSEVTSFEAVSATDVLITLAAPNPQYPGDVMGCPSLIGSPTAIQEKGDSFGLEPVGAGPFVLVEWLQGSEARFERNPNYWDAPKPYVDELILRFNSDPSQNFTTFTQGEGDTAFFSIASPQIVQLQELGFTSAAKPRQGGTGWYFNNELPPMDDVRVRQALALATDLDQANDAATEGGAVPAYEWFAPDTPWHRGDAEIPNPVNDLKAAQALIDEVVAEKGPIEFTMSTSPGIQSWAEVLQQQWSRLDGVTVNFEVLDGTEMLQASQEGRIVSGPTAWHGPDPHIALWNRVRCDAGVTNAMQYCNPEVDALLDQGKSSTDFEEREEIYHQIVEILMADMPLVTLYHTSFPTFAQDWVKGFTVFPQTDLPDFTGVWLDR